MNAHGYLNFTWCDDILTVEAFGPFNNEGAVKAAQDYINAVAHKSTEKFVVLEVLDENSLGAPETMKEVVKLWYYLAEQGCVALALVFSNNIQHSLAEKGLPNFGKTFSNLEQAKAWLAQVER